jgi:short-subunit dehydrogenase
MRPRYGPAALIAGASEGIGASFADALAARGLDVVLVARRAAELEAQAVRLRERHPVAVRTISADLSTRDGLDAVVKSTQDIGLLVVNAALAPMGAFTDLSPDEIDTMLDLNCRAAAQLTHALGAPMLARGRGGVILLSSVGGYQGSAAIAHYAATKAYLRVLAEGLWYEWRPRGVDVLACCPGIVVTPTSQRLAFRTGRLVPPRMDPDVVARHALAALGRRPVAVPGWRNHAASLIARLVSRRAAVTLVSRQTLAMQRSRPHGQ